MTLRDKLYQAGMRYLDAYLPEQHPILSDSRSRRRLRIVMGVGTVFDLILISKLPVVIEAGGLRLFLFVSIIVVFTLGLAWLLLTRARAVDYITAAFIGLGIIHNIIDAYAYPSFPPRNLPFFPLIILATHLLFGRWYSLTVLFGMSAAYAPLIHVPSPDGIAVIDPLTMDYRINVATNTIIAGLMVWLISEAYDYFRESSERQLRALNRERDKDLELAARVQQDLIPPTSRVGAFRIDSVSRPASVVGGDYHEAVRAVDANWFAIGDVTGHGLQAGMLSMQVRSMLVYLLSEAGLTNPADVLVELNNAYHQVVRKLNIRSYMTFLLVRIDDDGRLVFTGSHEKLIMLRHRSRQVEVIPSQGIWLGLEHIEDRNRIATFELTMDVDDTLLLFTDGLLESRNESGESFGFERLLTLLQNASRSSKELNEKTLTTLVMKEFDRFKGAALPDDDVTLFCIRRVADSPGA